jgi:hypothetical protein
MVEDSPLVLSLPLEEPGLPFDEATSPRATLLLAESPRPAESHRDSVTR